MVVQAVRMVDPAGQISTLVGAGHSSETHHTSPIGCDPSYLVSSTS